MKLINKMLLVVGLLAFSSVGFASVLSVSHMDAGVAGSEGEIFLIQDGIQVPLSGDFGDNAASALGAPQTLTTTAFYGLTAGQDSSALGFVFNVFATNPPTNGDVVVELFQGADPTSAFLTASLFNTNFSVFNFDLLSGVQYYLRLTGLENTGYSGTISAVPVPAAGILFASALFGAGFLGRRKKKVTKSNMIGAFARAA